MTREEDIWYCLECGNPQGRHDIWFEGDICSNCNEEKLESKMNTTENNKLIAEFLNWYLILQDVGYFVDPEPNQIERDTLIRLNEVFKDWNYLMKAVEKIESFEILERMGRFNVNTKNFDENYTSFITDNDEDFIQCEGETKKQAVYNACVEFVKWYNQQNQK